MSVPATRKTFTCVGIHPTWPEPDAVDFMRERQMAGRIVTYFDWGEYAIWNMPAGFKVSMDGRRKIGLSEIVRSAGTCSCIAAPSAGSSISRV